MTNPSSPPSPPVLTAAAAAGGPQSGTGAAGRCLVPCLAALPAPSMPITGQPPPPMATQEGGEPSSGFFDTSCRTVEQALNGNASGGAAPTIGNPPVLPPRLGVTIPDEGGGAVGGDGTEGGLLSFLRDSLDVEGEHEVVPVFEGEAMLESAFEMEYIDQLVTTKVCVCTVTIQTVLDDRFFQQLDRGTANLCIHS